MRNALGKLVTMLVHCAEGETNPSENSTKGTSQRSSAEKQRDAIVLLIPFIPHRQIKHHTGKQSTLRNTQSCARREISSVVVNNTQQRGDNSPDKRESRQPDSRRGSFEHDVAGNFE